VNTCSSRTSTQDVHSLLFSFRWILRLFMSTVCRTFTVTLSTFLIALHFRCGVPVSTSGTCQRGCRNEGMLSPIITFSYCLELYFLLVRLLKPRISMCNTARSWCCKYLVLASCIMRAFCICIAVDLYILMYFDT
jgi:hypothetical protein